jgi:hypothetical protein
MLSWFRKSTSTALEPMLSVISVVSTFKADAITVRPIVAAWIVVSKGSQSKLVVRSLSSLERTNANELATAYARDASVNLQSSVDCH